MLNKAPTFNNARFTTNYKYVKATFCREKREENAF